MLKDYGINLEFCNIVLEDCKKIQDKYELPWQFVLAVCALETGWGKSSQSRQINNFFNVKAIKDEPFEYFLTKEYDKKGNIYTVNAKFKKYENKGDSFIHFAEKLTKQDIYIGSFKTMLKTGFILSNFKKYLNELAKVYATSPDWSDNVYSIMYRIYFNLKEV